MYLNDFENKEGVVNAFYLTEDEKKVFEDATVLFASYTYQDYSGSALVIYELHGKLYEVHGSHCSCNGLEGQWSPEETSYEALSARYNDENAREYFAEDHGNDASALILKIIAGHLMEKEVLH